MYRWKHTQSTATHRTIGAQCTSMVIAAGNFLDLEVTAPVNYIQIIAHFIRTITDIIALFISPELFKFKQYNVEKKETRHSIAH